MTKVVKKIVSAICWYCGGDFIQRNTRAHYCSDKCRKYALRSRNRMARETIAKPPQEVSLLDRVIGRVGERPGKIT